MPIRWSRRTAWFRDLAFSADVEFDEDDPQHYGTDDVHKVANEVGKRADQVERIGRLGGIVAPILNQGDVHGFRQRHAASGATKCPGHAPVPARPGRRVICTPSRKWAGAASPSAAM